MKHFATITLMLTSSCTSMLGYKISVENHRTEPMTVAVYRHHHNTGTVSRVSAAKKVGAGKVISIGAVRQNSESASYHLYGSSLYELPSHILADSTVEYLANVGTGDLFFTIDPLAEHEEDIFGGDIDAAHSNVIHENAGVAEPVIDATVHNDIVIVAEPASVYDEASVLDVAGDISALDLIIADSNAHDEQIVDIAPAIEEDVLA